MLFREGDGAEEEAGKKAKPSSVQVQNILDYSYFEKGAYCLNRYIAQNLNSQNFTLLMPAFPLHFFNRKPYFLWLCFCCRDRVRVFSTDITEKIALDRDIQIIR